MNGENAKTLRSQCQAGVCRLGVTMKGVVIKPQPASQPFLTKLVDHLRLLISVN